MKSKLLLSAALAAALSAPALAGSFTLEGLALTRDDYNSTVLARDSDPSPAVLVRADNVDVEWTGGARATLDAEFWGHDWQLSGFFVVPTSNTFAYNTGGSDSLDTTYDNFSGSDINDITCPGDCPNSDAAQAISVKAEWELWGGEFNWVKDLSSWGLNGLNFIAGARYINFSEDLNTVVDDSAINFTSGALDFAGITVRNNLAGVQIGFEGDWNVTQSVKIGGNLKGGIAANFVSRDRSFTDSNGFSTPLFDSTDDTEFAQFVEFNPRVTVALSDNASLVVGGNVLWLNEVSTAAAHYETVADRQDANLRADDDVLVYGATVGLKLALN